PERPARIEAVWNAMQLAGREQTIVSEPADDARLKLVHPATHLAHIATCVGSYAEIGETFETYVGPQSDRVARIAVAACCEAAEFALTGSPAFAAVRPPGHHCLADRSMGFCLYANLAIAARHLQRNHDIGKIGVLDFDVHHGNGTQDLFYDDPSVFTASIHQHPDTLWPGSGFEGETGRGDGLGTCMNLPLRPGDGDRAMLDAVGRALDAIERFGPDVLLVSAGFDAHALDPLARLEVSTGGFGEIGRAIKVFAEQHCQGRVAACMEGGYHLDVLGESVVAFCDGLAG
ncbi:MAG: histone deacetylase, partial [Planctomycetota bacterium]